MLTCIPLSNRGSDESPPMSINDDRRHRQQQHSDDIPTKTAVKDLSSQIKDMAVKASGAYRHCTPFYNQVLPKLQRNASCGARVGESDSAASGGFRWSHRRTGGRRELESRLKGISNGEATPSSSSGRRVDTVVFVEEIEPKEWVAQVEPGVLITFLSLPRGGNDLKRIRFSREMFNKCKAQKWWTENAEKVIELYNVQRLNLQPFPLPTIPKSEEYSRSKMELMPASPVTPPLCREPQPPVLKQPIGGCLPCSLSDSSMHSRSNNDSCGVSTPNLSSISGSKTETSSVDASMSTSSSLDISMSNASDLENEWVEEDETGVYITIRALPDGRRELRHVRFSREKFGEVHARLWWEENRARVHKRYL